MTYKFSDSRASLKRAQYFAAELMKASDELLDVGSVPVLYEHRPVFPTMFGWWRLVNRSVASFWDGIDRGYTVELAPIVRNVFDHTLAMVWLADVGEDGLRALGLATYRSADNLVKYAKEANWAVPSGLDQQPSPVPKTDPDYKKISGMAREFDNFLERTKAFDQPDMYVVFKYLSGYSHANLGSADSYTIYDKETGKFRLARTAPAKGRADEIWTAVMLIQAGHAISPMIDGDPMRPLLNKAANDLGLGSPEAVYPVRPPAAP
ncbi:DUF5677 domain-containing protein [Nonomuraea recticatena]|uniref:Uncharacterized protein n=1 Tax=Nonomuraea recticatena TaxID=46178 RepID=A0ABN3T4S1_9ACTN